MRTRAMTLLEVLIVIALLALIAAFAWPDFRESVSAENVRESGVRLRAVFSMCRAEAMNTARRYRVTVWPDGRVRIHQQRDPILAPHEFIEVDDLWNRTPPLQENVWVTEVTPLPDGPPPIIVEDRTTGFETVTVDPVATATLEEPLAIFFEPDGTSTSARLALRDTRGRGVELTLDGRLGRIETIELNRLPEDQWSAAPVELEMKPEELRPLAEVRR